MTLKFDSFLRVIFGNYRSAVRILLQFPESMVTVPCYLENISKLVVVEEEQLENDEFVFNHAPVWFAKYLIKPQVIEGIKYN